MAEDLQEAILEALQTKVKDYDYFSEQFNTREGFMKPLHHHEASNHVYEVVRRDDGEKRAVKKVDIKFEDSPKRESSSSLSKQAGMSLKKFLQCLQESVIIEKYFSNNTCIVRMYQSWLQHTAKTKGSRIDEKDLQTLLKLIPKIEEHGHDIPLKLGEKTSVSKLDGYSIFIEMELYNECLERHLDNNQASEGEVPWNWFYLVQNIAVALEDIHGRGFVHFDVKPKNTFLDNVSASVGDFGSAKHIDSARKNISFTGSTKYYNSDPNGPGCGFHFDIWSLGCLIIRMFCRDAVEFRKFFDDHYVHPKLRRDFLAHLTKLHDAERLDKNAFYLITHCLQPDLSKRFTASDVVKHIDKLTESGSIDSAAPSH